MHQDLCPGFLAFYSDYARKRYSLEKQFLWDSAIWKVKLLVFRGRHARMLLEHDAEILAVLKTDLFGNGVIF